MKSSKKLVLELKRLNQKLDRIGNNDRYMIYNANPLKFAFFNFIAGIFHSLGALIGTAVIAGAVIYLFSQINLSNTISSFLEQTMSQIRWEKVIPTTTPNTR